MKRHVILVGLPGAGKTTIGRLVAEQLGAAFMDIDAMIVRRLQKPVVRIFAEHGEPYFREVEAETMRQALAGPAAVIAAGGGWAAQEGAMDSVGLDGFLVYLRTMALTAAKRAGAEATRPLLVGEDPTERMRELLREREPFYLRADTEVKADIKTPPQLAEEIVGLARTHAGW